MIRVRNSAAMKPIGAVILGLAAAGCQAPSTPQAGAGAPQASSQAGKPAQVVLKLYSGSSTGLVVGGSPGDANPGQQLAGLSFDVNPGLPQTFIWAFTPDSTILDRDCHTITRTAAINIANSPGANSAVFIQALGGGRPVAPLRVQVAAGSAGAADCRIGGAP